MAVSAVNQTVARRTLLVPWFHRSFDIFDRHFQHFLILASVASSLLSFSFVGRSLVLGSSGISASATASRKGLIVKAFWILNEGVFCCCTKKYIVFLVLFATSWALSYSKSRKHPWKLKYTRVSRGYHRVLSFKHRRLLDQSPVKMKQVEHQPVQAHRYRFVHLKCGRQLPRVGKHNNHGWLWPESTCLFICFHLFFLVMFVWHCENATSASVPSEGTC